MHTNIFIFFILSHIHQQKVTFGFTRIMCILIQIIRKMHEIQTEGL